MQHAPPPRIAETLEGQFAELTETRPETVGAQCAEAGLIGRGLWGKAGQRSLERSALVEAVAPHAGPRSSCFAACNSRPAPQVKPMRLANSLLSAARELPQRKQHQPQARVMIGETGGARGAPLLLYSVLYGFFIPKFMNFDGDARACAAVPCAC